MEASKASFSSFLVKCPGQTSATMAVRSSRPTVISFSLLLHLLPSLLAVNMFLYFTGGTKWHYFDLCCNVLQRLKIKLVFTIAFHVHKQMLFLTLSSPFLSVCVCIFSWIKSIVYLHEFFKLNYLEDFQLKVLLNKQTSFREDLLSVTWHFSSNKMKIRYEEIQSNTKRCPSWIPKTDGTLGYDFAKLIDTVEQFCKDRFSRATAMVSEQAYLNLFNITPHPQRHIFVKFLEGGGVVCLFQVAC